MNPVSRHWNWFHGILRCSKRIYNPTENPEDEKETLQSRESKIVPEEAERNADTSPQGETYDGGISIPMESIAKFNGSNG